LRKVPVNKVKEFETSFLESLKKNHSKTLTSLKAGKLTDDVLDALNSTAAETSKLFE
jgi:F-type H+-transporting ATPase subunit alpha